MKYRKVLLKLSGEALMGEQQYGIDPLVLQQYCSEVKQISDAGVQLAIVIGGGNIFRGMQGAANGFDRIQGDYMGMLATVINSLALQAELEKMKVKVKLLSGLKIEPIAGSISGKKVRHYLQDGFVVILAGGTGNPFFTTDTASALRAVEMNADILLKGTRVDGVYNADPEKDLNAVKYANLTFAEAYEKHLKIMDMTAFTLCRENNLPVYVFDMNKAGNLLKVIKGEDVGTLVSN